MPKITKELILQKGAEIVHLKGFNNTGIQEVLKAAKVPKGSFYFYFKNKEEFGLQLLDYFWNYFYSQVKQFLIESNYPYLTRLKHFFDSFLNYFENIEFKCGCPVGNFAQEMADINEAFRIKLDSEFEKMVQAIVDCLISAQNNNEISSSIDILATANFIINSWEGALLRTKVTKNSVPLRQFENMIFEKILVK